MQIFQALFDGVLIGGVYALAALGLSLIFGVLKITNFCHGALMTVGMYAVYVLATGLNASPYLVLPLAVVLMFGVGYAIQRFLIQRIDRAPAHNQLLLTLGISYILENLLLIIYTPNYKTLTVEEFRRAWKVGFLSVTPAKFVAFVVVVGVTAAVYWFLYRTEKGTAIRAASQNGTGARLMGINVKRIKAIAFGVGTICTGIAGGLITPMMSIYPSLGESFQLKCFVIAVLGGMGNLWGALISGLLIGVIESVSGFLLGGSWSEMIIYVAFILILLLRPQGLFGRRNRRES